VAKIIPGLISNRYCKHGRLGFNRPDVAVPDLQLRPARAHASSSLNGQHSVWYGFRCLGQFTPRGQTLRAGLRPCHSPERHFTVSNSCGQITYHPRTRRPG
jgi:hypothetical protein